MIHGNPLSELEELKVGNGDEVTSNHHFFLGSHSQTTQVSEKMINLNVHSFEVRVQAARIN